MAIDLIVLAILHYMTKLKVSTNQNTCHMNLKVYRFIYIFFWKENTSKLIY